MANLAVSIFALAFSFSVSKGLPITPTPNQKPVIVDTDPGIDDAAALLTVLGDPTVKLLAVTVVRGNSEIRDGTMNVLKILQVAGRLDVPVYAGENHGLIDTPPGDAWFGTDGLADLLWSNPPSRSLIQKEPAASFLSRIVNENPGQIMVLATGPLTNIALALSLNAQFGQQVNKIVVMGGSVSGGGNIIPGVEFNFYMDAEAASLVLDRALACGNRITIVPMETCSKAELGQSWRWDTLSKIKNPAVTFLNKVEGQHYKDHPWPTYTPSDVYTATVMMHPEVVKRSQPVYGLVDYGGQKSKGGMFIDSTNFTLKPANIDLILEVDRDFVRKTMLENLSNFG